MSQRAIVYARVSGDDRGKDGRNLAGQLEMGREYALSKGYQIVAELAEDDRGASGAEIDLPELNTVRAMARADEFDVLIVREIDRLSRNLAKQLIVEQELERDGVRIEYVLGEYPNTPEGRLQKHIKATIAEYEREKINERMVRGRRNVAKAGHVMGHGRSPYGYRLVEMDGKRTLVIDEQQARVVRLIFQWYTVGDGSSGPLSIRGVADKLTGMKIPTKGDTDEWITKQRERGAWGRSTVRVILQRETYAGVFYYGKVRDGDNGTKVENPRETWIPVDVPAIVSREVWESAQRRLEDNRRRTRRVTRNEYLLRSRVTCAECKASMCGKTVKPKGVTYSYYVCWASSGCLDYARECKQRKWFRVDWVDATVWDFVCRLFADRELFMRGLRREQERREEAAKPLRSQLAVAEGLLAENKGRLERLLDLYLAGDFDKEMLMGRKARLERIIANLEQERAKLRMRLEAATLSDEQVESLAAAIEEVGEGFDLVSACFEDRCRMIEMLNLTAQLEIIDGKPVAHIECYAGYQTLSVSPTSM
jgi:site-specific DNA recombinase